MGTWGAGNLDSDYARDELCTRSAKLIRSLMARALKKTSRQGDEYDYTTLFVEFEIVFALDSKGLLMSGALPTPDEVAKLKARFLADWESYYRDDLEADPEYLKARRNCIARTFERFKRICADHQSSPRG